MVADKVQSRKHRLVASTPEAATQLLQEDRRALRGARNRTVSTSRDVETLVKQIHREQHVDARARKPPAPGHVICAEVV